MAPKAPDPEQMAASMVNRPNWHLEGACRDVDQTVFFPVRDASVLPALAVCSSCNVQPQCLRYALTDSDLTGVWGGTSERGRRLIRSAAKKPSAKAEGSLTS